MQQKDVFALAVITAHQDNADYSLTTITAIKTSELNSKEMNRPIKYYVGNDSASVNIYLYIRAFPIFFWLQRDQYIKIKIAYVYFIKINITIPFIHVILIHQSSKISFNLLL